jgi:SAM-dependent methyltransferase
VSQPALPLNAWLRWDLVRRLVPAGARTVLEIGCGQGAVGARLAAGHDYLGVEPDGTSYATAQARIGQGKVLNGMVDDVVEAGRTFDLVCAFEVLEHLEDDAAALAGWVARVAPGGWLMLSTPAFQDRYGPFDRIVGHYRRYEKQELRDKLAEAGLSQIHIVSYGFPFENLVRPARIALARMQYKEKGGWDQEKQSQESGFMLKRRPVLSLVALVMNKYTLLPFNLFASLFNSLDLAEGYIASAFKPAA